MTTTPARATTPRVVCVVSGNLGESVPTCWPWNERTGGKKDGAPTRTNQQQTTRVDKFRGAEVFSLGGKRDLLDLLLGPPD
ncbi:hypothetical protein MTP99_003342 [Tenebrio molitor]|nr:hypothetical protein MTP99_003342 [Tenebrio molitor]